MNEPLYIAIDLGAGSGRVFLAGLEPGELYLEEVRRFYYPAVRSEGHLRWRFQEIFDEVKSGLRTAGERARGIKRPIRSIGVDGWGVDYGLVDAEGTLIEEPIAYRDERTQGVMEKVFEQIPREEIFERTGIQFMPFNTLFQLWAHARAGIARSASRLLLIPDLINFYLSGRIVTEYTNATTTQLVNSQSRTWDLSIIERLGLPRDLFSEIVPAGSDLGMLNSAIADELQLPNVRVIAPATHDTGSAVAGSPLEDNCAYISSGTWSLVGIELDHVLINADVARFSFTNEGGAFGAIRFLKNVMGLWILESCRKEWNDRGIDVNYDYLLAEIELIDGHSGLVFPDDPRLFNPPGMLEALKVQLLETNQPAPSDPPSMAKIVLDSLAFRYASVLRTIQSLTNREVEAVQIVGGGSQNEYLNQATATATGLPVIAGPVEATVIGNAMVQAIASGRFGSLAEARRHIGQNISLRNYAPRPNAAWGKAALDYAEIEARYGS